MHRKTLRQFRRQSDIVTPAPAKRSERKEIVHEIVPEGDHADGEKLGQIEIQAEAAVQQPDRQVVDDKSHGGNAQKAEVLSRNIRILVVESPDPVQDVIRRRGAEKAERIGDVLVEPQPLLAKVGDSEIDEDARAADDAEFEKQFYHKFPTSVGTDFPLTQFV